MIGLLSLEALCIGGNTTDFDKLIRTHGPVAVEERILEHNKWDSAALLSLDCTDHQVRLSEIRSWLTNYKVFMGFDNDARSRITEAFLIWADQRDKASVLQVADLVNAHEDLTHRCASAFGARRSFTSLSSKALWLCYPEVVPMFDTNAQRALMVLCKLNGPIQGPEQNLTAYHQFVLIWRAFYERHLQTLSTLDLKGYKYMVRVFDQILWNIGAPGYELS